jgi:hypothetical protein
MVTAKSGDYCVIFTGSSPRDIQVGFLIKNIISMAAASTIVNFGADLVAVMDGEHGDRLPTKTDCVGPEGGPFTVRVRAIGPKVEVLAAAVACAKQSSMFGLYGGEDVGFPVTYGTDGALLAFASFYAGCHPT